MTCDLERNNQVQITIGKGAPCPLTITREEQNIKKVIEGIKKELTTKRDRRRKGRSPRYHACRFYSRGICIKGERYAYGHANQTRDKDKSRTREEIAERQRNKHKTGTRKKSQHFRH